MSGIMRSRLYESIQRHVNNTAPGLVHTLNIYCKRFTGKDCIALFLEEPWVFKDILIKMYDLSPTVEVIARMFLHPVILETGIDKSLDELVKLLMINPRELHRIIQSASLP